MISATCCERSARYRKSSAPGVMFLLRVSSSKVRKSTAKIADELLGTPEPDEGQDLEG